MNDLKNRWLALYVLCLGDLMIVLDPSIVNVALPSIQADLGFSQSALAWVVNAYLLTFGGFLLLCGPARRPARATGGSSSAASSSFTVASVACGLAPSAGLLVVGRAVQGLGGAAVSAVALALIMGLFTDPAERAKAMGVFGFVMSGGGAVGVLLGGVLTGLLVLALDLPGQRADRHRRAGRCPLGCCPPTTCERRQVQARRARRGAGDRALMLAVYAIVGGNEAGWTSTRTLGLLGAAPALLVAFVACEAGPPTRWCRCGCSGCATSSVSQVVGVLWAAAMFAWFFLAALYLQQVLGLRRRSRSAWPSCRPAW